MRKRHRGESSLGSSKKPRYESLDDIDEDPPGEAASSHTGAPTPAPILSPGPCDEGATEHFATPPPFPEDVAVAPVDVDAPASSSPHVMQSSVSVQSFPIPSLVSDFIPQPSTLRPVHPPSNGAGLRSPLESSRPHPARRSPSDGDEEARWLADHVQQILQDRMPNPSVDGDEVPASDDVDFRPHSSISSFLRAEVHFLTEEEHDTHVSQRTFTVPIWLLLLGVVMLICASCLYRGMVHELTLMQPAMLNVVHGSCGIDGVCANVTDVVMRVVCTTAMRGASDRAALEQCLEEAPHLPAAVARAAESFTSSLALHCHCRDRVPNSLVEMCPAPFPDSPLFYFMVHPIESWVLPAVLLDAPRLGSLYILKHAAHYQVEELINDPMFWLAWLLTPHYGAALLVIQALYSAHPILVTVYVLFCCRGQVTEWRQLIQGPPGTLLFLLLDSFVYTALYLAFALTLPIMALNLTLVWSWVSLFRQTLHITGWWNAPLRQPLSKALLQQMAQHLFSIWAQEIRRSGYADYPPNYSGSATTMEELQCTICCHHKKDTALIPCCHVVCKTCAHRLPRGECPFCHSAFQYMQFVRL